MRRAASLTLLALLAAVPVSAQTPTPGGGRQTIEFLYNRLLALEARVAQVESRTDDDIEEADLVGRYLVTMLGVELGQAPYVATEASSVIVSLNADRTVTGTLLETTGRCRLMLAGGSNVTCEDQEEPASTPTWRYENGYVILTDEEGDEEFLVGAGGGMILGGGTINFLPGHGWSAILVGMRLPTE
jgi:hypothetical protein